VTTQTCQSLYAEAVSLRSKQRLVVYVELAMLFIAASFFCIHSLPRAWKSLNTDFPNYYLAARLAHEGVDTSRMYEWSWIERQKNERDLDIRVIGLLPITPFSTLIFWPLTFFGALTAKHIWILLNLAFLIPIAWLLHSLTGLYYRRIALILLLSFPLYRNLLYGQFYIFLLLLILGACFSYLRGYSSIAGALIALAVVCKIFPALLFVFFLRRRDWRALAAGLIMSSIAIALSVSVFGLNAHRVWLMEIFPWVMHGEGLGTYTTTASFSGVLHCLFLDEPQWNPHPWHCWPLGFAVLSSLLPTLAVAPAILLICREGQNSKRILLEWSSLITASLAISTIPASYNFVLMVFPVCVLSSYLLQHRRYGWLLVLLAAYLGIGFPLSVPQHPHGLTLLLYVPRLPLMLALLTGVYALQWKYLPAGALFRHWEPYAWAGAMAVFILLNVHSTLTLEQGERKEYAYRLPLGALGFSNTSPQTTRTGAYFIAFTLSGYRIIANSSDGARTIADDNGSEDILSFTASAKNLLAERASTGTSQIVDLQDSSRVIVEDAHDPMLSHNGHDLAFLRDNHGHSSLILRREFRSASRELSLTPSYWNVYEASFLSSAEYAVSSVENGHPPSIFLADSDHGSSSVVLPASRYPALSPDGRYLAYSHLDHGFWNLWLRDENSGAIRRIADVPCNQVQPAWEDDAKTLLYGTDCGRSIWFTAIAQRKVIP
jgi:hypothetical protein